MSYFFNERNFYSVMWELVDKDVQKNVYMVYEQPNFVFLRRKIWKSLYKKN